MPGLAMMLKALGIKITPETLAQIEALLPQIPAKVNQLIEWNRTALIKFSTSLESIVSNSKESNERLQRMELDMRERLLRIEVDVMETRKLLTARQG